MTDLMRFSEAAARLNCHERQVRRLVDKGLLRAVVIGPRTRRIDPVDLEAFKEAAKCQSERHPTPATRASPGSRKSIATGDELDAVLRLAGKRPTLKVVHSAGSPPASSKKR